MISSYSTVYRMGHRAIQNILEGEVEVQEKVDGSQISFGILGGQIFIRSKNKEINLNAPEGMFELAINSILRAVNAGVLREGVTYRGEYLSSPRHNVLEYSRVPRNNIVIFDVDIRDQWYVPHAEKQRMAELAGFECVPLLFSGIATMEMLESFLNRESFLGGTLIEGVVVKNYLMFTGDKKVAMGKLVSDRFQEVNEKSWRKANPTSADVITSLINRYRTDPRWEKAVQHLEEDGELTGTPADIGKLIREVPADIRRECEEEIKQILFDWAWSKIARGVTAGLPEWYKQRITERMSDE